MPWSEATTRLTNHPIAPTEFPTGRSAPQVIRPEAFTPCDIDPASGGDRSPVTSKTDTGLGLPPVSRIKLSHRPVIHRLHQDPLINQQGFRHLPDHREFDVSGRKFGSSHPPIPALLGPIATLTGTGIIEKRHSKYGTRDFLCKRSSPLRNHSRALIYTTPNERLSPRPTTYI
jgi:hypothetical protein